MAKRQSEIRRRLAAKKTLRVAGLMSGTSLDGVDVAIADIDGQRARLLAFDTFAYPAALRRAILDLCDPATARLEDICHYNVVLGKVFAEAVIKLCRQSRIALASLDLLGSHGQTICHLPPKRRGKGRMGSTLQIGDPAVIAQRTGVTTVADFRPGDMAAGGEGAPLAPYGDWVLFRHRNRCRAIQNIGGIANVTYLPPACRVEEVIAFDTGPGNMVIDRFMHLLSQGKKRFDRSGQFAAQGAVNRPLLTEMLRHRFLSRRPPKSTGREAFGRPYSDEMYQRGRKQGIGPQDLVATATAFTAVSIARAYRRFLPQLPDEMILCGGGAHNLTLAAMLQQELDGVTILSSDFLGVSVDAREALSFAILARATTKGIAGNIPGVTGAGKPVILGKIITAS